MDSSQQREQKLETFTIVEQKQGSEATDPLSRGLDHQQQNSNGKWFF